MIFSKKPEYVTKEFLDKELEAVMGDWHSMNQRMEGAWMDSQAFTKRLGELHARTIENESSLADSMREIENLKGVIDELVKQLSRGVSQRPRNRIVKPKADSSKKPSPLPSGKKPAKKRNGSTKVR